jgi:hypothetical protein
MPSLGNHFADMRPPSTGALIVLLAAGLVAVSCRTPAPPLVPALRVPEHHPTIQSAIDAASTGDVIDVAPGTYAENLTIDTGVTLRARIHDPADPRNNTVVLDGGGETVVDIPPGIGTPPELIGFAIRNGEDGIHAESPYTVRFSLFTGSKDHIDNEEGAGGLVADNVFEGSGDDAIDIDHPMRDVTLDGNLILGSEDDGIEIRLHDDAISDRADIVIRDNQIVQSDEDGIQLIDYPEVTNRRITIERNLIRASVMAGIGLMDNGETEEDFRAASIPERIHVFHNTLVANDHGISGGDNLIAVNNIFLGHGLALKKVDGDSIVSHSLFWANTTDSLGSAVDAATTLRSDPALDGAYLPGSGSPAIDAGTARFEWSGELVLDRPGSAYRGSAPDLGWRETAA